MQKNAPNEIVFNEIVKIHWGHIVALLTNHLNDIELAEDAMQDAFESALLHWQRNGIPQNPQAWLFITAKHKALDKMRRTQNFKKKQDQYQMLLTINADNEIEEKDYLIPDERLRLIFTCCHPALDKNISVALTLKLLCGLTTREIARAYLVKTETMAQRLVRGKRKIRIASIPYCIPEQPEFSRRLDAVLTVLYLIFNEGYSASSGELAIRKGLSHEAIRLTELLLILCLKEPEVKGLLSLMLLHDSRRQSRFDEQDNFIPLALQDRSLWVKNKINRGVELIEIALKQKQIGIYQLQAAISAVHSEAKDYQSTNWHEIVLLYNEILKINASNTVKLNRLVALSHLEPVTTLMPILDKLASELMDYQPFYVVKADFLNQKGDIRQAEIYYKKAIKLSDNLQIKNFLKNKIAALQ